MRGGVRAVPHVASLIAGYGSNEAVEWARCTLPTLQLLFIAAPGS